MKPKRKRGTDGYGSWSRYDDFEVDLSFSWLMLTLVTLAIGIFIMTPRVPIVGVPWVIANVIYLFKKIRDVFIQRRLDREEPVEEEKVPYHIQLAREEERKAAEARSRERADRAEKELARLEEHKNAGLISRQEYDRRRQELLDEN